MIFGNKFVDNSDRNSVVSIDSVSIKQVSCVKFLGVYVDEKLSWKIHIFHVSAIISKNIGILSKLRYKLPSNILLTLYNSLILPHLSYCAVIWGSSCKTHLDILLKLQKRAMRIMSGTNYLAHSNPLFILWRKLKITDIYKLQTAVFVYDHISVTLNNNLTSFNNNFCFQYNNKQCFLRNNCNKLIVPFSRTELRKNCIKCQGPILWNGLPENVTTNTNRGAFKRHLIEFLL